MPHEAQSSSHIPTCAIGNESPTVSKTDKPSPHRKRHFKHGLFGMRGQEKHP
ncbi:hypothetical protein OHAE_490 [Ochrobactrum soli]|uniref:Uncharacterized protein n=1 Tax=Ochrobactrum soli TaxID=2448455 RepID=A0A2P9HKV5_9HYPH|nr:hypothetical protein OHAE_490 [[Ochrobactrum] soli]